MVILNKPYGQRSNNLFQHIHLDSFCIENKITFFNPFFSDFKNEYLNFKSGFDLYVRLLLKMNRMIKVIPVLSFNSEEDNPQYFKYLNKKLLIICEGWAFRSFNTTIKYRNYYKELFKPNIDTEILEKKYVNINLINLGVHIRRGDYKNYQNGRFFYSDDEYINFIKKFIDQIGKRVNVIIVSNDNTIDVGLYNRNFENLKITKENAITDQFILSKCNYIIGPPSTFSLWSSYIGEVPFYHFYNNNSVFQIDDFKICNG